MRKLFIIPLLLLLSGFVQAQSTTNLTITKPQPTSTNWLTNYRGWDKFDAAIAGRLSKSVAGSSDVTLTETEARNKILEFTGALTGNINVIVPSKNRTYVVYNNTSGAFTLTVKTAAGTGVAVTQTNRVLLYCDATNINAISSGSALPATDTTSIVEGSADSTKEIRFEVDGLTTGTVRVLTPPNANITIAGADFANAWGDGVRQTFNPDGTNAGLNVGSHSIDPGSATNGDIWYNSTETGLKFRINGVTNSMNMLGNGTTQFVFNTREVWRASTTASGDATDRLRMGTSSLTFGSDFSGVGQDVAFTRNAAGLVEINDGNPGTFRDLKVRQHYVDQTITAGGTTGAQTINKAAGTVNFAAAATSLVVTNNLVTTSSLVFAQKRTNDGTCQIQSVVPASGSFTINMTAGCGAETSVGFLVINK